MEHVAAQNCDREAAVLPTSPILCIVARDASLDLEFAAATGFLGRVVRLEADRAVQLLLLVLEEDLGAAR